jgi:hypothetical protein
LATQTSHRKNAAELALKADVILAHGSTIMGPLQPATHTIPIVFVSGRPRCRRFRRPSLARQGANATGFTSLEYAQTGKSLELLKEIAPKVERVAVIGLIAPLDSLPPQVRRNLMRGQPRFSVWVAFPFTLHSICLASGRGLPYQFRGLAGRCCSCLYSFPRSRVYRYIRRGAGIQVNLTSYEGAFIIGCHFLGCNYLGIIVCLTGSKGEKLHCD